MNYPPLSPMARLGLFSLAVNALLLASPLSAQVSFYYDDFNGLPSDGVNSSTPDISLTGDTWRASSFISQDGSFSGRASAYLPISGLSALQADMVYTASLTLDIFNSTSNWISVGFAQSVNVASSDGLPWSGNSAGLGWLRLSESGDVWGYAGPRLSNELYSESSAVTPGIGTVMEVVLTTGSDLSSSHLDMYVNGYQLDLNGVADGATLDGFDASVLGYVGIGSDNSTTLKFDQFSFSESSSLAVVPEPKMAPFLAGTWVAMFLLSWRRRCRQF